MCGIIGYSGTKTKLGKGISCLEKLEYRGYDSSGIAYLLENNICIEKAEGKIENLKKKIDLNTETTLFLAHTRWATHGKPNEINAHPHQNGSIVLVHNGIIENTKELKDKYLNNISLKSETDTEVAAAFLNYLYQKELSLDHAITIFFKEVKGSYAIVCTIVEEPNILYAIKKDSPILLGIKEDSIYIASDIPAILNETKEYVTLEDYEYAKIKDGKVEIFDKAQNQVSKKINTYEDEENIVSKEGYQHFMLKEIYEQPKKIKSILNKYIVKKESLPKIEDYDRIQIVACGSAYHAGLLGKFYIEKMLKIPVEVELASEYRYKEIFVDEMTLVIFISQSGETADTLAAVKKVENTLAHSLGIINVVGSSIAREVEEVIYTEVGNEIAVATTKAYSAQVAILLSLAYQGALRKKIISENFENQIEELDDVLISILNRREEILTLAKSIYLKEDMYFIGRLEDEALAREASLKMKEITYIHSESYASGELKHGTISLIEQETPVIGILTNSDVYEKTISNLIETSSRGSNITVITSVKTPFESEFLLPKKNHYLMPFLTILVVQLLAYEVALLRNCSIDQPKNLAKSVTVE